MSLAGDEPGAFDGVRVPLAGQWNRVAFLASSGATIDEVLMKQVPKVPESANQITLTVGGNDVGFMTVAQACAEAPSRCQGAILAAAQANVTLVPIPTGADGPDPDEVERALMSVGRALDPSIELPITPAFYRMRRPDGVDVRIEVNAAAFGSAETRKRETMKWT